MRTLPPIKSTSGTCWVTVHDGNDPLAMLETQLSEAVGQGCRPQLFAAIRSRVAQGNGPSVAVLGGLMWQSGVDCPGVSDALSAFGRFTSELLQHYSGNAAAQLSNRPGIFRFESMLRMRRMLMTQLEALMTQQRPDVALMARQLDEVSRAVSMMGGVPAGFGLRRLIGEVRDAAGRFGATRIGGEDGRLRFFQKRLDGLQKVWPLEDPELEHLPSGFIEEVFSGRGYERSVQMAAIQDITRHGDRLLRDPVKVLGRALEKEWCGVNAYLLSQFIYRYGERYIPPELENMDAAKLDPIGAIDYDASWKSYEIMWEMLRALGRHGVGAGAMLKGMTKRFVFLTGVLSSYCTMLKRGMSLHTGKGRMTESLKDMPEFEELMVLVEVMRAIDPETVAGNTVSLLVEWLQGADMSPADRGYVIWRLQGVIPSEDVEYLAGNFRPRGIIPYAPRRMVDPKDRSFSDHIRIKREGGEFRELVGTVRDLSSPAEESARAIEQIGLKGGLAAARLIKDIVLSAPPQLVPRGNDPSTIVPSPDFMGNTEYWLSVTPAAIEAMHRLGVDAPRSIITTANFSYARVETRYYGTVEKG